MSKGHVEFWMCMVDGVFRSTSDRLPKYKHYRECEARAEAERLSRLAGKDVFLLHASEFVQPVEPQPPVVWHKSYREGTFA